MTEVAQEAASVDVFSEFLNELFSSCSGDELIEIAHGDFNDPRRISEGQLFSLDRIEEAAKFAHGANRSGVNVYVGAALRDKNAHRGRGGKRSMALAPMLWADFDGEGEAEFALKRSQELGLPPHLIVTTGAVPHLRQQFWWRLEDPIRNPAALEGLLKRLHGTLGVGDSSVTEAGRVMRIAGSIAWPTKPHRVKEVGELIYGADEGPYTFDQFDTVLDSLAVEAGPQGLVALDGGLHAEDGSLALDDAMRAALEGTGSPSGWRPAVLRIVARLVNEGWTDSQFGSLAPLLTRKDLGYSVPETRAEIHQMVFGARRRWGIADPVLTKPEIPGRIFLTQEEWWEEPEPRQLVEGVLIEGTTALIYGSPGSGKSFTAIDLACSISAGKAWHGHATQQANAAILSGEGSIDLRKRIACWDHFHGAQSNVIHSRSSLKILDKQARAAVIAELIEAEVKVLFIDTVRRSFSGNEDKAEDAGPFMDAASEIGERIGGTVVLVHHARKGSDQIRGSSVFESDSDTTIHAEKTGELPFLQRVTMHKQKMLTPMGAKEFVLRSVDTGRCQSLVPSPADEPINNGVTAHTKRSGRGRKPGTGLKERIMHFLEQNSEFPHSSRELASVLKVAEKSVMNATLAMKNNGQIVGGHDEGWRINDLGADDSNSRN